MRVMTRPFSKPIEIKELPIPVKQKDQKSGCAAAEKTGDNTDDKSGEAMPRRHAGIIPRSPSFFPFKPAKAAWILSFAKTEISDPMAIPIIQYQKICLSWSSK